MQPVPIWLKSSMQPAAIYQLISHRPAGFAVVVLVLLAVAAVTAVGPLRCRPLAALAAVTLVISLGSLVTYSGIPVRYTSLNTLGYLIVMLFPIGVLSWLVVGSWAVLTGRLVLRRLATTPAGRADGPPGRAGGRSHGHGAGRRQARSWPCRCRDRPFATVTSDPAMAATRAASRQIVRTAARTAHRAVGPRLRRDRLGRLTLGLTWALTPHGFHAEIMHTRLARELGDRYIFRGQAIPMVRVRVRRHGTSVAVTKPTELPAILSSGRRPGSPAGQPVRRSGPARGALRYCGRLFITVQEVASSERNQGDAGRRRVVERDTTGPPGRPAAAAGPLPSPWSSPASP